VKETIEAHRRLLQALVALLLPAAMSFGCATLGVVPEIGRRTDRISRFERVLREDERLVLFYRIDTFRAGTPLWGGDSRSSRDRQPGAQPT